MGKSLRHGFGCPIHEKVCKDKVGSLYPGSGLLVDSFRDNHGRFLSPGCPSALQCSIPGGSMRQWDGCVAHVRFG